MNSKWGNKIAPANIVGMLKSPGNIFPGKYGHDYFADFNTYPQYKLSGNTIDSTGAALGNCIVYLFYTDTNILAAVTTSAANGFYQFLIGPSLKCYCVAYKQGSPDVEGTTVNTLMAS